MGVDHVLDYHQEGVVNTMVNNLRGKGDLAGVYDAIFAGETIQSCAETASHLNGKKCVGTVLPPGLPLPTNTPEGIDILVNSTVRLTETETARAIWSDWLPGALVDESLKCKPDPEIVGRGLEKIQDAVDAVGEGVSGRKLVIEL